MARKPADQSVNRDEIISAAAEVLQRSGYEAATMKEIAAAVNLTAASLYHHFRNKDALLIAVLENGLQDALDRVEAIAARDAPPYARLRAMCREHVLAMTQNLAVGVAMIFEIRALMNIRPPLQSHSPEDQHVYADLIARRDAFFARRDHFERLFRGVVEEGIARGDFRPVDAALFTKSLMGAHNWVGVWYNPNGRLTGDAIAEMMADMLLRGVCEAHAGGETHSKN